MDNITQLTHAAVVDAAAPSREHERRLLVVDDEEVICQIVQGFLGVDGWLVDSASTLEQARELLTRYAYPVIICDVHIPGGSAEFLRQARETDAARQVIMFTGDPTINTVREALQHGAYEYVPKPCQRDELAHIVQRAYEKFELLREQDRLRNENEMYRQRLEDLVAKRTDQLRDSELRYRAVFHRAVDAIFLVDAAAGRILDANAAAARLTGVEATQLFDRTMHDFVSDQLDDVWREAAKAGYREWRMPRLSFLNKDGQRRITQVSIGKVDVDGQSCLQIVARDVTDHVELLEHKDLMEQELVSEQRLAAIGLLASGIAHNINTPLMGIYGAAQLLKMKHPDLDDMDGIIAQVERINAIIRNLMWKSRQEQDTRFQEINLNQLLTEELKFLEADLDYKHYVTKHFSFSDRVPTIMGRYSDFSQSIMNVVRNALDAMYNHEDKELHITTDVQDGCIRVAVRDNGCGIPSDMHDKIFMPFFSTKPLAGQGDEDEPSGTGLGLSTVRRLLEPYGAKFDVESEVGQGTTFIISLPVEQNQVPDTEDSSKSPF
jgi:PAS domain S-box-containing protein